MRCVEQNRLIPSDAFDDHLERLQLPRLLPTAEEIPILALRGSDEEMPTRRVEEHLVDREVRRFPRDLDLEHLVISREFEEDEDIVRKAHRKYIRRDN